MLIRILRLLDPSERRRLALLAPLVFLAAGMEIVGVSAVIPFVTLLAEPAAVFDLPVVGPLAARSGIEDAGTLLRYAGLGLTLAVLAMNTVVVVTRYRQHQFSMGLIAAMSTRLLRHYLAQPYSFTLTRNTGDLTNLVVREVERVSSGVNAGLGLLTNAVTISALLAFLVMLDPLLALTSFAVLGTLYGAVFLGTRRYLTRTSRESVRLGAERIKAVNEALGGFKELKVAGREGAALRHYARPSQRYAEIRAVVMAIATLPRYALEAIAVGGVVMVASLMAGREGTFAATLPLLGAYVFAALRLIPAMQYLFSHFALLRSVQGSVESLEADLAQLSDLVDTQEEPPQPLPFDRTITLQGVDFRYPAGEDVALHGIDLTLQKGRSLAIVGRTGSGKTTLVNVLLGLLEPASGNVAVDATSVTSETRRAYRRLFGYVPQDIFLSDDSVSRNVALGMPDDEIDDEAVRRACQQAQVDDFVERELPSGYGTVVGERGVRLSGGQRQRIGIARALYHQPAVLVFDEATSALDVHTERLVFDALDAIARERTLVMIAHRLDTVAKADHVLVLDAGRVVDEGPPDAVLARYRQPLVGRDGE